MIRKEVEKQLNLSTSKARHFVVSLSGGSDSTVLLYLLHSLRTQYPIRLTAFHINFSLRGRESDNDEKFVKKLCRQLGVGLIRYRAFMSKQEFTQEQGRRMRLQMTEKLLPGAEWVEGHHADDQLETFLFRLMRGSGLAGLKGMTHKSLRSKRVLWRPLLNISKRDILRYARTHDIHFREDESNHQLDYDRNWIRNVMLPQMLARFPGAKKAMLRTQSQILLEDEYVEVESQKWHERLVVNDSPLQLDRRLLNELPEALRHRLIHWSFRQIFGLILTRERVLELASLSEGEDAFTWNAPRGIVLRSVGQARIEFDCRQMLEKAEQRSFVESL